MIKLIYTLFAFVVYLCTLFGAEWFSLRQLLAVGVLWIAYMNDTAIELMVRSLRR